MIQERHPRFQPPGHGHVVHPLDRVVHDQGGHVQPQHPVQILLGIRFRQPRGDEFGGVVGTPPGQRDCRQKLVVIAVEIMPPESFQITARRGGHARIPEVAAEHLVGALTALHHLDRLGNPLGQQKKRHRVLPDHRFGHAGHRFRQALEHLVVGNQILVMAGLVAGDHLVGIFELAALFLGLILEADRKGPQVADAGFGQQRHQQAGVQPAR